MPRLRDLPHLLLQRTVGLQRGHRGQSDTKGPQNVRKTRVLGLVSVLIVAIAVVAALPAWAHQHRAYHNNDYAEINSTHDWIIACDREVDGHGVRAKWRDVLGNVTNGSWDSDGAGGSCVTNLIPNSAIEFRVCEADVSCSDWKFE